MADYQLTAGESIFRTEDSAHIPPDPGNSDYAAYLKWVEAGGVADPYVEPEPVPPTPTAQQEIAFDHENRIRVLEGLPPLTMEDFVTKMGPK
jgi:hypothetical protein